MLGNFDFALLDNEDFKEDSVRELIIKPLLDRLGFEGINAQENLSVKRSVSLKSDTVIGATKRIKSNDIVIPDYLLCMDSKVHCVLDAKAPKESIAPQSDNERQAFYYAINKDIKSPLYALCNGKVLIVYETAKQEVLLEIDLENDLDSKFSDLANILTTPLQSLREILNKARPQSSKKLDEWYLSREIPKAILKPKKQIANRYFGCMPYFTKQSWDIVAQNIKAFTDEGDIVLDSFGGSGVTAIEAMMNNRFGIHTDLNPLSIFMVKALCAKVNLGDLHDLSEEILSEFESLRPKNDKEAKALLKGAKYYPNAIDKEFGEIASAKMQDSTLWIPKDEILPKGSDVPSVLGLFSKTQLAELAILRKLIMRKTTKNKEMRYSLLLAFYNTVKSINLIFHKSKKGGGNATVFQHFRYRIAKEPTLLETAPTFKRKVQYTIKSKQIHHNSPCFYNAYFTPLTRIIKDFEGAMITQRENVGSIDSLESKTNGEKIFQADATNLAEIESQSVDFIYTDPPYSDKISYLDLSTMWNVWLDFPVDKWLKEKECIENGSLEKSRDEYVELMIKSMQEMFRVLKYNRWLAFVFQHEDPQLWQILVDTAENIGFEYVTSVRQDNGQTSFIKRQNKQSVLAGQLILYFRKVHNPKTLIKEKIGDTLGLVLNNIEALIARDDGATLEEIYADLQIRGLELGFYHELGNVCNDLTPLINQHFDLDSTSGKYHIRQGQRFKSHFIDIKTRARYFVLSFLRGCERQNRRVTFDDICLEVIPLLKNGIIPENTLISDILEDIAIPNKETGEWRLKSKDAKLFDDF